MSKNSSVISTISENTNTLTVEFKKPSNRYLDRFIKSKASVDLLKYKIYPNAKEVTEAYGMLNAAKEYLLRDINWKIICVGDGSTPRCGALFAFHTRHEVFSVDPALPKDHAEKYLDIDRLHTVPYQIQDCDYSGKNGLIISCHSHAKLSIVLKHCKYENTVLISMPCCVPDDLDKSLLHSYNEDWGVHSPQRRINIYHIVNKQLK